MLQPVYPMMIVGVHLRRILVDEILLPSIRPIVADWRNVNRNEAGILLAHMEHIGSVSATIVGEISKRAKKENPVRLLEAHMACLRSVYAEWVDAEPSEPACTGPSQHPTDAEMEAFERAEVSKNFSTTK